MPEQRVFRKSGYRFCDQNTRNFKGFDGDGQVMLPGMKQRIDTPR
jgi:hypothetical protein